MLLGDLARLPCIRHAALTRPEAAIDGLHGDSRRVGPGVAFFALRGERTDGHRFVDAAAQAGAPALIVTDEAEYARLSQAPPPGVGGVLLAGNAPGKERRALAELAGHVYGHPSARLRLYGVTGTNGKTTVTHLVAQLARALGQRCGVVGSLGLFLPDGHADCERTTPEAPELQAFLARCVAGAVPAVAMEVSSIGLAMERPHGLVFHTAAFTNLTQDHLDFHPSLEAYRAEKFRLFTEYAPGHAVVNVDDPAGRELTAHLGRTHPERPVLTYGLSPGAHLRAEALTLHTEGAAGRIRWGDRSLPFASGLVGRHNVLNLLAAVGILLGVEVPLEALVAALPHCHGAPGRFERVQTGRPFTVVVDYAHTPDALDNVLRACRDLAQGRVLAVFGCGGERDATKRPLMGRVAERLADVVVLTSDNPRGEPPEAILDQIAAGLGGNGAQVQRLADRRTAIAWALEHAAEGDVVLVAGKGHEPYQEIAGERLPFDDREVVRQWAGGQGA